MLFRHSSDEAPCALRTRLGTPRERPILPSSLFAGSKAALTLPSSPNSPQMSSTVPMPTLASPRSTREMVSRDTPTDWASSSAVRPPMARHDLRLAPIPCIALDEFS